MEFIEYSKCSTCRKAKSYLNENNIKYIDREIKEKNITKKEVEKIIKYIDINKLFNTSGLIYKEMKLKDKLSYLSLNEKIDLLINNPMLVKRPLILDDNYVLVGFKIEEWNKVFKS